MKSYRYLEDFERQLTLYHPFSPLTFTHHANFFSIRLSYDVILLAVSLSMIPNNEKGCHF